MITREGPRITAEEQRSGDELSSKTSLRSSQLLRGPAVILESLRGEPSKLEPRDQLQQPLTRQAECPRRSCTIAAGSGQRDCDEAALELIARVSQPRRADRRRTRDGRGQQVRPDLP